MGENLQYILQYLGLSSLQDWIRFLISGLIFSAIVLCGLKMFIKWGQLQSRVKYTVKFLCDNNHSTRNALRGKHLADRLLDIYNNGRPMPLISRDVVYERPDFWRSFGNENKIDRILKEKELVEIFEEQGVRKVKLSEDKFTDTVIKYLVKMADRSQI